MINSLLALFITVLTLPWISYFASSAALAAFYMDYIRGVSKRRTSLARNTPVVLSLALAFFAVALYVYHFSPDIVHIIRNLVSPQDSTTFLEASVSSVAFIAFLFFEFIRFYYTVMKPFSCKSKEVREVNGFRYVFCRGSTANAWFNWKDGKVYVGEPLHKKLAKDELKAVIYHEMGHRENTLLTIVSAVLRILWLLVLGGAIAFVVKSISSIVLHLCGSPSMDQIFVQSIYTINTSYWLVSTITVNSMIPSWIAEHECDRRALEEVGLDLTVAALVKVYGYEVSKYAENLKEEEVFKRSLTPIELVLLLMRLGANIPKHIWMESFLSYTSTFRA